MEKARLIQSRAAEVSAGRGYKPNHHFNVADQQRVAAVTVTGMTRVVLKHVGGYPFGFDCSDTFGKK